MSTISEPTVKENGVYVWWTSTRRAQTSRQSMPRISLLPMSTSALHLFAITMFPRLKLPVFTLQDVTFAKMH